MIEYYLLLHIKIKNKNYYLKHKIKVLKTKIIL